MASDEIIFNLTLKFTFMKSSVFCGYVLLVLFIAMILFTAMFPELTTSEQANNCLYVALGSELVSIFCFLYARYKGYRIIY